MSSTPEFINSLNPNQQGWFNFCLELVKNGKTPQQHEISYRSQVGNDYIPPPLLPPAANQYLLELINVNSVL